MKFSPSAKRNLLGQRPHVWKSCSYSIPLHRRALDPHLELQKSLKLRNVSGNVCSTQRRELPIWKEKRRNRFSPNNYTRWKSKKNKAFWVACCATFPTLLVSVDGREIFGSMSSSLFVLFSFHPWLYYSVSLGAFSRVTLVYSAMYEIKIPTQMGDCQSLIFRAKVNTDPHKINMWLIAGKGDLNWLSVNNSVLSESVIYTYYVVYRHRKDAGGDCLPLAHLIETLSWFFHVTSYFFSQPFCSFEWLTSRQKKLSCNFFSRF